MNDLTIADVDELVSLLKPENGNKRWDMLQGWLKKSRIVKRHVETCLSLSPSDAVDYLAREFNLPASSLRLIFPNHPLIAKFDSAMCEIQILYRERLEAEPKKITSRAGKNPKKKTRKTTRSGTQKLDT
jgi:hypothetical protein